MNNPERVQHTQAVDADSGKCRRDTVIAMVVLVATLAIARTVDKANNGDSGSMKRTGVQSLCEPGSQLASASDAGSNDKTGYPYPDRKDENRQPMQSHDEALPCSKSEDADLYDMEGDDQNVLPSFVANKAPVNGRNTTLRVQSM